MLLVQPATPCQLIRRDWSILSCGAHVQAGADGQQAGAEGRKKSAKGQKQVPDGAPGVFAVELGRF